MNQKSSNTDIFDVIIIGGGPAGLTAGIYCARNKLNAMLLEKGMPGGKMAEAWWLENFPGFEEGVSGFDLSKQMHNQAVKHGLNVVMAEVISVSPQDKVKKVNTSAGEFSTKAIIVTGGSERRKLDVPGEDKLLGKGISYCATCDGPFFKEKVVAVIGGGNAAVSEAIHLAQYTSKVYVIHRRDQLRAFPALQEKAFAEPKIEFVWDSVVDDVEGDTDVTGVRVKNKKTGELKVIEVNGVFVSVGLTPNTSYLGDLIPTDEYGNVRVNLKMETEVEGVFAAGDIRQNSIRQAIAAAGDGSVAAVSASKYINEA